jgi:hypothetical protein
MTAWLGKLGFPKCTPINALQKEMRQVILRVSLRGTYEDLSFDRQAARKDLPITIMRPLHNSALAETGLSESGVFRLTISAIDTI